MKRKLPAFLFGLAVLQTADFDIPELTAKAAGGDAGAAAMLGMYYEKEEKDTETAEKWLSAAANAGNAEAQYALAELYDRSGRDLRDVLSLTEQSAAQGFVAAQVKLAKMYQFGRKGLPADLSAARRWYEMAAAKGSREAMRRLELIYRIKGHESVNAQKATENAEWLALQVKQGNAEAALQLGMMAEKGIETERNPERAAELYAVAARAKIPEAQARLGMMYERGDGVPQSDAEAEKWLTEAALHGYVEAQRRLYSLYVFRSGRIVDGYAWLLVSLSEMFPDADDLLAVSPDLASLMAEMTPDQIGEGNKAAAAFSEAVKKNRRAVKSGK